MIFKYKTNYNSTDFVVEIDAKNKTESIKAMKKLSREMGIPFIKWKLKENKKPDAGVS